MLSFDKKKFKQIVDKKFSLTYQDSWRNSQNYVANTEGGRPTWKLIWVEIAGLHFIIFELPTSFVLSKSQMLKNASKAENVYI